MCTEDCLKMLFLLLFLQNFNFAFCGNVLELLKGMATHSEVRIYSVKKSNLNKLFGNI